MSGKDALMELRREDARRAAQKLLATQSCTEEALTEALLGFAKENVEWLAKQMIEGVIGAVEDLENELCDECKKLVTDANVKVSK